MWGARRAKLVTMIAAVAVLALPSAIALAAPGDLDTSYGLGSGKSLADFGGSDAGNAVALQPDGKIIVAGYSNANGSFDFAVARLLNPQGTFDPSYGLGSGKSLADFGGSDAGNAVALQPDGKIIVAGYSNANGTDDFAVARLLSPQGIFDPSYGLGSGKSLADFGGLDQGNAVALQPDGKIVVAGRSDANGTSDFAVARLLNPQGTFDPSYGLGSGKSLADFGGYDEGRGVTLQPDGKIVVAGFSNAGGNNNFAVARLLNPQGTFDPSYGLGSGKSLADLGESDVGHAVALQPDGKIVVAGSSRGDFAVARLLNPQGTFDPSYGLGSGRSLTNLGGTDVGTAMALQPDGKIIVAGESGGNFAVVRLQPNGSLDSTFGNGGKSIIDFGGDDAGRAVALQPDGKIVVAGSSGGNFAVARLQGDPPSPPPSAACKEATIIGTANRDKLVGTKKRDVIAALGGPDTVRAGKGNDVVCAGPGKDKVVGAAGKDKLLGEKGKDTLSGGKKKDKLLGGPGKDTCNGGPGKDKHSGCEKGPDS